MKNKITIVKIVVKKVLILIQTTIKKNYRSRCTNSKNSKALLKFYFKINKPLLN